MSIGKLTSVNAMPDFVLEVGWDDGFSSRLDLLPLIKRRSILNQLGSPAEFERAALSADAWSVEWPCGIDFGAPQLRRWAVKGFDDRAAA